MSLCINENTSFVNSNNCCNNRNAASTLNSEVVVLDDCALIHEQFTLNVVKGRTLAPREDVIYRANRFANCLPGAASINPFGTIIARNFSSVPVSFDVIGVLGTTTMIVQPNSEVAVTLNSISEVNVNLPTDAVRLQFLFDIFYPANPSV